MIISTISHGRWWVELCTVRVLGGAIRSRQLILALVCLDSKQSSCDSGGSSLQREQSINQSQSCAPIRDPYLTLGVQAPLSDLDFVVGHVIVAGVRGA